MEKKVWAIEMSCSWVSNREKQGEKVTKYAPLRLELARQYPGYEIKQCNIILDLLGGWSKDLEEDMRELLGIRSTKASKDRVKSVLAKIQKAVLSSSLNIARHFKLITR